MHYVFVLRLRAENVAELVMQAAEMGVIGAESWRSLLLKVHVQFIFNSAISFTNSASSPARTRKTSLINVKPSEDSCDPTLYMYSM